MKHKYLSIIRGMLRVSMPAALGMLVVAALGFTGAQAGTMAQPTAKQKAMMHKIKMLESMAPYKGYLEAHAKEQHPLDILGGPIRVQLSQNGGGVFVALPDHRKLDPAVFGTPARPRAFGGFPIVSGVPLPMRGEQNGHYTTLKRLSPFGDKFTVMADGHLKLMAVDETATDAAVTKDSVHMMATWKDKAGNTYEVKCCKKMAAHGIDYPTFGGVATNIILHGSSRIGTPLMPTEFTYLDFWGMGSVAKNGKVLAAPRLIHGMLTEYVRTAGYKLGFDKDVTPTRLQFHLMVPPAMPDPAHGMFRKSPVPTGLKLPNGMQLPFWHVMFENLKVHAQRGS